MLGQQKQLSGMHLTLGALSYTRRNATTGATQVFFASFSLTQLSFSRPARHIVKIANLGALGALLVHCYFEATVKDCAIEQLKHGLKSMATILTI